MKFIKAFLIGVLLLGLLGATAYGGYMLGSEDVTKLKDDTTVVPPTDQPGTDDSTSDDVTPPTNDPDDSNNTDPDDSETVQPGEGEITIKVDGVTYCVFEGSTWLENVGVGNITSLYDGIIANYGGTHFLMMNGEYIRSTDVVVSNAEYALVSCNNVTMTYMDPDDPASPRTFTFSLGLRWSDIMADSYGGEEPTTSRGNAFLSWDGDGNVIYNAGSNCVYYLQCNGEIVKKKDLLVADANYTFDETMMACFPIVVCGTETVAYYGETFADVFERDQSGEEVLPCSCLKYYCDFSGQLWYRNEELYEGEVLAYGDTLVKSTSEQEFSLDGCYFTFTECQDAHWDYHVENESFADVKIGDDGYVMYYDSNNEVDRYILLNGEKVLSTDHIVANATYTVEGLS